MQIVVIQRRADVVAHEEQHPAAGLNIGLEMFCFGGGDAADVGNEHQLVFRQVFRQQFLHPDVYEVVKRTRILRTVAEGVEAQLHKISGLRYPFGGRLIHNRQHP